MNLKRQWEKANIDLVNSGSRGSRTNSDIDPTTVSLASKGSQRQVQLQARTDDKNSNSQSKDACKNSEAQKDSS